MSSLLRLYTVKMSGSFQMSCSRFFHIGQHLAGLEKSSLAKLRKRTGFSISNCKKALEKYDNDIKKAEEWLHAEAQAQGWAKATKLTGRATTQGLIGLHVDGPVGTLVEVNCETDFVAKNERFRTLVSRVAKECATGISPCQQDKLTKEFLSGEQMGEYISSDGKKLADHVALEVGMIGENINLARAARFVAPEGLHLIGHIHPSPTDETQQVGRYGAIMSLKKLDGLTNVAKQLCLHVVGMNPKAVGDASVPKAQNSDDENILFHQEFLNDPTKTVGEVLQEENMEVIDFIRFECGEQKEDEEC